MVFDIIEKLENNKKEIINLLSNIETVNVAQEEIRLSINALKNSNKYINKNCNIISSYLPMNLPLYSLIIYVIIPKNCSNESYYRPSSKTLDISIKLHEILNLENFNIKIVDKNRQTFFNAYVNKSDVIIFVGKPYNAQNISDKLKKNSMFIYFGVGQNPIIVEEDAPLELASKKITEAVMFNYGQDCTKPNSILIKRNIYDKLKKYLLEDIKQQMINKTSIKDINSIKNVIELLINKNNNIQLGGNIDLKNNTLDPIIICSDLNIDKYTYNEYYAPVFKIYLYDNDNDLKKYFNEKKYKDENMNISLFGTNKFIENLKDSIIINNEIIKDLDNGYCEFGGYGNNVSYLNYYNIKINKPILINREIEYFFNNNLFSQNIKDKNNLKNILYYEYKKNISSIFKDNLNFSFIFGSYAKNKQRSTSDMDIFICTLDDKKEQLEKFISWYFEFHYMYGLIPDFYYPGEILSKEKLNNLLENNKYVTFDIKNSKEVFDSIFYTQIFTDKKCNILGNISNVELYERKFNPYIKEWCNQIFELLDKKNLIMNEREYMKCLRALGDNNLLFFSNKLHFETEDKYRYIDMVKKIDDGLLRKILYKK